MRRTWFGSTLLAVALLVPATPAAAGTTSPSGRIVFVDAFGGSGIYAIGADGANRVRLVEGGDVGSPRWAPDGSAVAFTVARRFFSFRIDQVDGDGGNRATLISRPDLPEGWAIGGFSWSPDATHLAIELWDPHGSGRRLYVTPTDGSALALIARNAGSPDWSTSGKIVATRGDGIVTMDPDGANQVTIVDRGENVHPRWSPDGTQVVFERRVKSPGNPRMGDVLVANADGSGVVNLTRSPRVWDWSPTWSPTGSHIAWSPGPIDEPFGYADLWRMRATGGGKTPVSVTTRLDEYLADWADAPV